MIPATHCVWPLSGATTSNDICNICSIFLQEEFKNVVFNPHNNPLKTTVLSVCFGALLNGPVEFLPTWKHAASLYIVVPVDTESTFCNSPLLLQVDT